MKPETTAILLIGYQNDYFASDGRLYQALTCHDHVERVRERTVELITQLEKTPVRIIATPIIFTPDYSELSDPVGILAIIREAGAFRADSSGSDTIEDLKRFGDRIEYVPGKRGLNAFAETHLDQRLRECGITDVVLAGVVSSLCIDSTARSAHERGYRVTILGDTTSGRTDFEQQFYTEHVFPMYAEVKGCAEAIAELKG